MTCIGGAIALSVTTAAGAQLGDGGALARPNSGADQPVNLVFDEAAIATELDIQAIDRSGIAQLLVAELQKPRRDRGLALDEEVHAPFAVGTGNSTQQRAKRTRTERVAAAVLHAVHESEDQGLVMDIANVRSVALGTDIVVAFTDDREVSEVTSERYPSGTEHLSILTRPIEDETRLTLDMPAASGFASPTLVSSGGFDWVGSDNGRVWSSWWKYKDLNETDSTADYFVYKRRSIADPADHFLNRRWVSSADLQSGITDGSAWKVIAKTDWDPWTTINQGGDSCSNTYLEVNIGILTLGSTPNLCDRVTPNYIWGGLWTRFEAKQSFWEAFNGNYAGHFNEDKQNEFLVTIKVEPNQTPYWWDYADGYFKSEWGTSSEPINR